MWDTFLWRWDPIWAGVIVILALLYEGALRFFPVPSQKARQLNKQRLAFFSGLILSFTALGSPLAPMGQHSFSMQMLRLSLICWFAPPLILLGLPPGLLRPLWRGRWRRAVFSYLTHPLIALISFHFTFIILYYPPVFDGVFSRPFQGPFAEVLLVLTAYLMWWPVFCPYPEWDRLNEWKKIVYITVSAVLLTPVSLWLLFADVSLYGTYETVSNPFALDPVTEQKIAGGWMKLVQIFLFGGVLTYWFIRWIRKEEKKEPINRKAAEREAVARLLLNQRIHPGEPFSSSKQPPAGKPSSKVIPLSDRMRKKNRRVDT